MTVKTIKELFTNFRTSKNDLGGVNKFTTTTHDAHGKIVVVVNYSEGFKTVIAVVRVADGVNLIPDRNRPCDGLSDAVDVACEMLHDMPDHNKETAPADYIPEKITISKGNSKVGAIKSVSLPPVVTCAKGCPCAKDCYAVKLARIYPTVRNSYNKNLDILNKDGGSYFEQIAHCVKFERFFRWHVSGDIVNRYYFDNMVAIADTNPHCTFLAFTKRYDIVNGFLAEGRKIPDNLKIIFSAWDGYEMPNPYNLPTSHVIFKGQEIPEGARLCGGNCQECTFSGAGCWSLKNGEKVAFFKH